MLDPLALRLITLLFAVLLIAAGVHKLGDRVQFQGILRNYRILPEQMTGPVSLLIPGVEIVLGLAWVFAVRINVISVATAALLTAYAGAMGINLLRGRTYIDCGCGFAARSKGTDHGRIQQLSVWLVYRNLLLIMLALLANAGVTDRSIGALDYFSFIAAALALMLVWTAFNQLLLNNNAIDSWRKPLLLRVSLRNDLRSDFGKDVDHTHD